MIYSMPALTWVCLEHLQRHNEAGENGRID